MLLGAVRGSRDLLKSQARRGDVWNAPVSCVEARASMELRADRRVRGCCGMAMRELVSYGSLWLFCGLVRIGMPRLVAGFHGACWAFKGKVGLLWLARRAWVRRGLQRGFENVSIVPGIGENRPVMLGHRPDR